MAMAVWTITDEKVGLIMKIYLAGAGRVVSRELEIALQGRRPHYQQLLTFYYPKTAINFIHTLEKSVHTLEKGKGGKRSKSFESNRGSNERTEEEKCKK